MIRLLVFDLDGTLVDSQQDLANAANALVRELGGRPLPDAAVVAMVGEGAAILVQRVLDAAGLDQETSIALPRFLELYDQRLVENTLPYAGIPAVLEELRTRSALAVLTNKPQQVTDRLLAALDLCKYFAQVVGGDTAFGRKPHPEGLLRLCTVAGTSPDETVLVGDSAIDLATARRAGTGIILVSYGFGYRFANAPDCPIASTPADIVRWISL
jgi:phosphoglycolate phosphatase